MTGGIVVDILLSSIFWVAIAFAMMVVTILYDFVRWRAQQRGRDEQSAWIKKFDPLSREGLDLGWAASVGKSVLAEVVRTQREAEEAYKRSQRF